MREVHITWSTNPGDKDADLQNTLLERGARTNLSDGRDVLDAVDNALSQHGLEIVYGVNPADDEEILILAMKTSDNRQPGDA